MRSKMFFISFLFACKDSEQTACSSQQATPALVEKSDLPFADAEEADFSCFPKNLRFKDKQQENSFLENDWNKLNLAGMSFECGDRKFTVTHWKSGRQRNLYNSDAISIYHSLSSHGCRYHSEPGVILCVSAVRHEYNRSFFASFE